MNRLDNGDRDLARRRVQDIERGNVPDKGLTPPARRLALALALYPQADPPLAA